MSKRQRTVTAGRRVYRIADEKDTIIPDSISVEAKNDEDEIEQSPAYDSGNQAIVFNGSVLDSGDKILITYEVEEHDDEESD